MDIEAMLKEAQEAPDYYYGELSDLVENNCARTGHSRHRDSDVLDISNYETILQDLLERFGSDIVHVASSNHWAVGWVDEIIVTARSKQDKPHPAFVAAMEWHDKLADYPVADEDDLSKREYEDAIETLENCYNVPTEQLEAVFTYLFDNYSWSNSEEYRDEGVQAALKELEVADA